MIFILPVPLFFMRSFAGGWYKPSKEEVEQCRRNKLAMDKNRADALAAFTCGCGTEPVNDIAGAQFVCTDCGQGQRYEVELFA